jgi:hypothetical protein
MERLFGLPHANPGGIALIKDVLVLRVTFLFSRFILLMIWLEGVLRAVLVWLLY